MAAVGPWQPRVRPVRSASGSIFGMHTVDELADLIAVVQYEKGQFDVAIANCQAWQQSDPQGFSAFQARWTALAALLPPLVDAAQRAVDSVKAPIPMGSFFPIIGSEYTDLVQWRTKFGALNRDWVLANKCAAPNYSQMPQPKAIDPDLMVYKRADQAAKLIERATHVVVHDYVTPALVGGGVLLGLIVAANLSRRR